MKAKRLTDIVTIVMERRDPYQLIHAAWLTDVLIYLKRIGWIDRNLEINTVSFRINGWHNSDEGVLLVLMDGAVLQCNASWRLIHVDHLCQGQRSEVSD